MKNLVFLFFCLVFSCSILQAQESSDLNNFGELQFDINTHFSVGIPINQLKGNMDPGFGFGVTALFGKKGIPVVAGLDYRFHFHNLVSRDVLIYNGVFDELHRLATKSYSHQGDIVIRAIPEIDFPVIPYVDVFFGFNRFATWTSIEGDEEYKDDSDLDSYNTRYRELGDWTKAYGLGIGLRGIFLPNENVPELVMNLRVSYRKGGVADYLTKKDDFEVIESTVEAFEEKNTTTDFLIIQFGIAVILD